MAMRFRLTYSAAIDKLRVKYAPKGEEEAESIMGSNIKSDSEGPVERHPEKGTFVQQDLSDARNSENNLNKSGFDPLDTAGHVKAAWCLGEACRKKSHKDCIHRMCFLCCYCTRKLDKRECSAHHAQTVEREREDRYIEEGLAKRSKKSRLPFFHEERFSDSEQTVVVWCLKDFASTKKWNEECFAQEFRKERQQVLSRRRQQWREDTVSCSEDSALPSARKPTRGEKRKLRYSKIRQGWSSFVLNCSK